MVGLSWLLLEVRSRARGDGVEIFPEMVFLTQPELWEEATGRTYIKAVSVAYAVLVPWFAVLFMLDQPKAAAWSNRLSEPKRCRLVFLSRVVPVYVGTVAAGLVIPPAMRGAGYFWPDQSVLPSLVWVSVLRFLSGATSVFLCALVLWFLFSTNPSRRR